MPEIKKDIRGATLVVAADDSLHKNMADYVCSGVADDVEIQLAHDALPAGGGKIVLLDGTYNLAAAIVITKVIELSGQGWNTILYLTDNTNTNLINIGDGATGLNGVTIRDLAINGNRANNAAGTTRGIEMLGAVAPNQITRTLIDHVYVTSCHDFGITGAGANDGPLSSIVNCEITDCADDGIYLEGGSGYQIIGNYVHDIINGDGIHVNADANVVGNHVQIVGYHGIYVGTNCTVTGNYIEDVGQNGVNSGSYSTIDGNFILDTSDEGIYVGGNCVVSNNIIFTTVDEAIRVSGNCVVSGNFILSAGLDGILVNSSECIITGNRISSPTDNGIRLVSVADRCLISGNNISGSGANMEDGIHLEDGASECVITGNYCYNGMGSGIALTANNDDCVITDNICQLNDDYGIEITVATCDRTIVKNNKLIGNVTGQFLDGGTNTQLATYVVPFSHGSDPQDSGYEIDLDTEYARAWLRLPAEVQQVVRMRIYARAIILSGTTMALEINVNGGADNEPFNTHATAAPNTPSTSTNFAANDVIFWTLTSAEIVALVGGDSIEVKVLHEAANGGGVITDAYLRTVEMEYV